jgi:predicted Fe-Mo cluster-binding NifX family protein
MFLLFALVPMVASAAGPVVVGVAAEGKTPSARVSDVAARCPYFLLFDGKGAFVEAVANPHKDAEGGGPLVVGFLAEKGVKVAVAGGFGPRIVDVMKAKGMRPVEFNGSAADAVKKALAK